MNPYQILGIEANATHEEVRSAYRTLARRWHPDRFMEGPERDWANEKMCAINAAYNACLNGTAGAYVRMEESERLKRAEQLIREERYQEARAVLMSFDTRCAEWNCLFGTMLAGMGNLKKAEIYLGIATRQAPENARYRETYQRLCGDAATRRYLHFLQTQK
ncbi:MAG: J domain-containing protein [Clostridia bacterium]|nr:J domain-containing protein [Clostridia bacterium]